MEYQRAAIPDVSFDRLNRHYEPAIRLAQLILHSTSIELRRGAVRASSFLVDMNIALREGVRSEVIGHLDGTPGTLTERETAIVETVRELCSSSSLSTPTFSRVEAELGTEGVVELTALVGYYTMLGYAMAAFDVCVVTEGE